MPHETALIATVAAGLGLAFLFGFAASRLGLPPLVGYLLAGVALGPFTPGYVADAGLASQLAEIGVILLMFSVGLHFSLRDLLAVRRIAVPGAVGQIAVATALGAAVAHRDVPYVVVEQDRLAIEALRRRGVRALYGDATRPSVLAGAHLERARLVVVAAPAPYQAREIVKLARRANPAIDTVVRTHSAAEQTYLERAGVGRAVLGERELALGMAHYALRSLGQSEADADAAVQATRAEEGTAATAGGAPRAARTTEEPISSTG